MQTPGEFLRLSIILIPFAVIIFGLAIGIIFYYLRQYQIMRNLRGKYLDDLENERHRISMELHDIYGPYSMQLHLNLRAVKQLDEDRADKMGFLLDNLSNDLMLKNQELYPLHIHDESFDVTLRYLAETLSSKTCTIALIYELDEDILPRIRIHLYRILQELILNAIKHVNPSFIQIEVIKDQNNIEFTLYYPNPERKILRIKKSRFGQTIINERLRRIDAKRSYELKDDMTIETITINQ